jgi:hypothetical protein
LTLNQNEKNIDKEYQRLLTIKKKNTISKKDFVHEETKRQKLSRVYLLSFHAFQER